MKSQYQLEVEEKIELARKIQVKLTGEEAKILTQTHVKPTERFIDLIKQNNPLLGKLLLDKEHKGIWSLPLIDGNYTVAKVTLNHDNIRMEQTEDVNVIEKSTNPSWLKHIPGDKIQFLHCHININPVFYDEYVEYMMSTTRRPPNSVIELIVPIAKQQPETLESLSTFIDHIKTTLVKYVKFIAGGFELNKTKMVSFAATTISHWWFGDDKLTDNSTVYLDPNMFELFPKHFADPDRNWLIFYP